MVRFATKGVTAELRSLDRGCDILFSFKKYKIANVRSRASQLRREHSRQIGFSVSRFSGLNDSYFTVRRVR